LETEVNPAETEALVALEQALTLALTKMPQSKASLAANPAGKSQPSGRRISWAPECSVLEHPAMNLFPDPPVVPGRKWPPRA
jgi:hypothetical protein